MGSMKRFSIIIAAYNCEEYIKKCLDSVLNQSFSDYELIVVDDKSSDDTLSILESYSSDSRVSVFQNEVNSGVSFTRNRGLSEASGEYVLFLDSDDWLDEDALSLIDKDISQYSEKDVFIYNLFKNSETSEDLWYNADFEYKEYKKEQLIDAVISLEYACNRYGIMANCRCIGGKVYRRSLITRESAVFPENIRTFEDGIFNLKLILNTSEILMISRAYYHYRMNDNSATHIFKKSDIEEYKIITGLVRKNIRGRYKTRAFYHLYFSLFSKLIYELSQLKDTDSDIRNILNDDRFKKSLERVKFRYLSKREKMRYLSVKPRLYGIVKFKMKLLRFIIH